MAFLVPVFVIWETYCLAYFYQEKLLQSYEKQLQISGMSHWKVYFSQ